MKKKLNLKNAKKVFDTILSLGKDEQRVVLEKFNEALDDLCEEDAFGTEGQCDPRGDQRE